jgi:hypothetical protein
MFMFRDWAVIVHDRVKPAACAGAGPRRHHTTSSGWSALAPPAAKVAGRLLLHILKNPAQSRTQCAPCLRSLTNLFRRHEELVPRVLTTTRVCPALAAGLPPTSRCWPRSYAFNQA